MTFFAGAGARDVLRTAVIAVAVGIVMLLRWLTGSLWSLTPLIVVLPLTVWYLPRLVSSLYGEINQERLYVRYGIVWRREAVVPLSALRTFETWTPLLHRLFHCRTIVLRFAGGCVFLPLLDEKTACRLTAYLEEC